MKRTATATDNRDRSPSIENAVGAGDWRDHTGPVTVSDEGAATVKARANDDAGNVSGVTQRIAGIDRTPPTAAATFDPRARAVATPPDTDVEVQARARCTAGKAHVAVTDRNTGEVPLNIIRLFTPYRTRPVVGVAPGGSAYQTFISRLAILPAGSATVRVDDVALSAPYAALSCG